MNTISEKISVSAQGVMQYRGRDVLRNVYYRVTVPLYDNNMYSTDPVERARRREAIAAYYCEVTAILTAQGWDLKDGCKKQDYDGCPQLIKGAQHLYCHPQSVSGHILENDVETLRAALATAKNFSMYMVDTYEFVIVTKDDADETALYTEEYGDDVRDLIKDAFTTPRSNLYKKDFKTLWDLYTRLSIRTTRVPDILGNMNPGFIWLSKQYQNAIDAGLIVTPQDGLARWLNKKEYTAWIKHHAAA